MSIEKTVEWEGKRTRLVRLDGLPINGNGYSKRKGKISRVYVHQSAGNFKIGIDAALAISRFHTGDPIFKRDPSGNIIKRKNGKDMWIGGGRGWPGPGYTFIIPGIPEVIDGKIEVYRVNHDSLHTYHTGANSNRIGVAVCFGGTFSSRHLRDSSLTRLRPEPFAREAGQELILEYLLPRYNIKAKGGLFCHSDVGKPACPGDWLENWVHYHRGDKALDPESFSLMIDTSPGLGFKTIEDRQRALLALGFDIGSTGKNGDGVDGIWGEICKGALIAFQDAVNINVDGRWGPKTEKAMSKALDLHSQGKDPFPD